MVIPGGVAGSFFNRRMRNERSADAARRSARRTWQGSLPCTAPRWTGTRRGLRRKEGATLDPCRREAPQQDSFEWPLYELGRDDRSGWQGAPDAAEGRGLPP